MRYTGVETTRNRSLVQNFILAITGPLVNAHALLLHINAAFWRMNALMTCRFRRIYLSFLLLSLTTTLAMFMEVLRFQSLYRFLHRSQTRSSKVKYQNVHLYSAPSLTHVPLVRYRFLHIGADLGLTSPQPDTS